MPEEKSAVIVSVSSDIGSALASRWLSRGWHVAGTYRRESRAVAEFRARRVPMVRCDLSDRTAVSAAAAELRSACSSWDVLVLAAGELGPVGPFFECDYDEWERSIRVNLLSQLQILRELLPFRKRRPEHEPTILFFAGGGTNSAPKNFSAYTVSKIALIKMCELLDSEQTDTKFVILGPGWVRTKIHETTLRAGDLAGEAYEQTLERLQSERFVEMEDVLDCCDWVIGSPRKAISGRNFSVAHDSWNRLEFVDQLAGNTEMCKLRRHGNDLATSRPRLTRLPKVAEAAPSDAM